MYFPSIPHCTSKSIFSSYSWVFSFHHLVRVKKSYFPLFPFPSAHQHISVSFPALKKIVSYPSKHQNVSSFDSHVHIKTSFLTIVKCLSRPLFILFPIAFLTNPQSPSKQLFLPFPSVHQSLFSFHAPVHIKTYFPFISQCTSRRISPSFPCTHLDLLSPHCSVRIKTSFPSIPLYISKHLFSPFPDAHRNVFFPSLPSAHQTVSSFLSPEHTKTSFLPIPP